MRQLDRAKIPYTAHYYEYDDRDPFSGLLVAEQTGTDPNLCYKTLVTLGKGGEGFVFVLPVGKELDLKKAAKAVGEKSVTMVPVKEIEKLTGYIRGGCTPVGMKKHFKTVIDISAEQKELFFLSGGKKGTQIEVNPNRVAKLIAATFEDITAD